LNAYFNKLYWSVGKGQANNISSLKRMNVEDFYGILEIHDNEIEQKLESIEKSKKNGRL
jgi:hypothetical protein